MGSFEDEFIRENIDILVFCVRNAGFSASQNPRFLEARNDVCVIPLDVEGITRAVRPLHIRVAEPVVDFAASDAILVGGAALQVYSTALRAQGATDFHEAIHDADFVWWPRVQLPADFVEKVKAEGRSFETADQYFMEGDVKSAAVYGVTSYSPAIQIFAELTAENLGVLLIKYLKRRTDHMKTLFEKYGIPVMFEDDGTLKIIVSIKKVHTYKAGVINVNCILESGDFKTTIIELAIHDDCSSQVARMVQNKRVDEMYLSESEPFESDQSINFIHGTLIEPFDIILPKFEKLFLQQWLVLQNRLKYYEISRNADILPKVQKHYMRMDYIYQILHMLYKSNGTTDLYKSIVDSVLRRQPNPKFVIHIHNTIFTNEYWLIACTYKDVHGCTSDLRKFEALCREGRILNRGLCDQLYAPLLPQPPLPQPVSRQAPIYLHPRGPRNPYAPPPRSAPPLPPPLPQPLPQQPQQPIMQSILSNWQAQQKPQHTYRRHRRRRS